MWKNGKRWVITPPILLLSIALILSTVITAFYNRYLCMAQAAVVLALLIFTAVRLGRLHRDVNGYLQYMAKKLSSVSREALENFPLPAIAVSSSDEILYYNRRFSERVIAGEDLVGNRISALLGEDGDWRERAMSEVSCRDGHYTVYTRKTGNEPAYILFFADHTDLSETAIEYRASRPVVMMLYIDNLEEVLQNARESERARLSGQVETLLEDWMADVGGILRKFDNDRFLAVMEYRYLKAAIQTKFEILDKVRTIETAERIPLTLSIGVSRGSRLKECEDSARQALDMALGRGGDQVAVKTKDGYEFFGGVSKGVEKRNKVRTRVMAAAIGEAITESDQVLVMGHRFSDLDAIGAAIGVAALARGLGKPAYVVVDREKSLAKELIDSYQQNGHPYAFVSPDRAISMLTPNTLLVITDTYVSAVLESRELYEQAKTVIVIDHHRKMVGHIERALLVYHEPYASSASEMVAEMIPYLNNKAITRAEAEALLSGIMLDTRHFVMKVGVRTFEAAASLRRFGADTIKVKRLFAGSMAMYQTKAEMIADADIYKNTAISCYAGSGSELRIAAAQAADELLSVQNVLASFTMFEENGCINMSARSLGDFNVQLVMEALGGGGHLMMAGAQLNGVDMSTAKERLIESIDQYLQNKETV